VTIPRLKRILYANYEPDIRTVAKLALETMGEFEFELCNSDYEALDKVAWFGPDLVLLDVMMPGMDGSQTLAELRASAAVAVVPVIFITAKVQKHEVANYREIGAIDVIAKPFDPAAMSPAIGSSNVSRGCCVRAFRTPTLSGATAAESSL
jgi:two-component system OmpR family response regulator